MPRYNVSDSQLTNILKKYELGELISVKEIVTGLINPVYLINDNLIIRIDLKTYNNPNKFSREAILYKILPEFSIPTPNLVALDESKEIIDVSYIVLSYIPGESLSLSFKDLDQKQQKEVSFQLGQIAKQIHLVKPEDIGHEDLFKNIDSWAKWTMGDFEKQWRVVNYTDFLSEVEKNEIATLYAKFKKIILSNKGTLTHGDFSAGNIQVLGGKIVGIFDFEFAFIADPFWDLQKLTISYQLGDKFDRSEFLIGYGQIIFSDEEKVRLKMYSYIQGVWEIWATVTQHMPFSNKEIREGVQIIQNTIIDDYD